MQTKPIPLLDQVYMTTYQVFGCLLPFPVKMIQLDPWTTQPAASRSCPLRARFSAPYFAFYPNPKIAGVMHNDSPLAFECSSALLPGPVS